MARTSHRNRIYDDYLGRIQRGEIGPDDRLIDTAIAAELGVSRMPVREALMKLAHEGYLVGTTRGFKLPDLSHREILDIFEIRRLLEPRAAAAAAEALDTATLDAMGRAVSDAASTLDSGDITLFFRASEAFRNAWLGAVPNAALRETIQRYLSQVQAVRLATMRDPEAHRVIIEGLQALLDGFRRRDVLATQDRMLRFVMAAEMTYQKLVSGNDS